MSAFYITPHAVARFRGRIAPLGEAEARAQIVQGLSAPHAVRQTKRADGVPVYDLAVLGPYTFIATVIPHPDPGRKPAVVSIRHGTKGAGRKPEYERATWRRL